MLLAAPALAPALASDVVPTLDERFGGVTAVQVVAIVLCVIVPTVGWALLFRQVGRFVGLYRMGQPDGSRTNAPGARTWTLAKEFLGHTRMSRLKVVAAAHWFTALAFLILFATLVNAFFQLIQPDYRLPVIGHFPPFEWLIELFAWAGLVGIVVLMAIRQKEHPRRAAGESGRSSRFFGSTFWQAYYVELTILVVTICILLLRGLEAAMVTRIEPESSLLLHFPLTGWMAGWWSGATLPALAAWVYLVAMLKIVISFAWMIMLSPNTDDGRRLAPLHWPSSTSGSSARPTAAPRSVPCKPMTVGGQADRPRRHRGPRRGRRPRRRHRSRTSPGRASSTSRPAPSAVAASRQCPAWNTEKPLSPKLLITGLRDHAVRQGAVPAAWPHEARAARPCSRPTPPRMAREARASPLVGRHRATTAF